MNVAEKSKSQFSLVAQPPEGTISEVVIANGILFI